MFFPHPGFGIAGTIFSDIIAGLVFIIVFIVIVGLLFVLVRFLLTATKAAELYIANNTPVEKPVAERPAGATKPAVVDKPAGAVKPTTRTTKPTL